MLELKRCELEDIFDLRHRILRSGYPLDSAKFVEDKLDTTLHFGLFRSGQAKVCLTLLRSVLDGSDAWQLRGMAADKDVQGMGFGGQLIRFAVLDALKEGYSNVFWCNARLKAVPFYQRNGWEIISPMFEVPEFGPHHKMRYAAEDKLA